MKERTPGDADVRPHGPASRLVCDLVDPAHLVTLRWPGGGEPRFPMQLRDVGYGHALRQDNPSHSAMTLWTPGGEHPVEPELSAEQQEQLQAMQAEMEQVRQQLLDAPAAVVVANHAMGLYELAALHLTASSPKLLDATLAIDALAALVERLEGRLGEHEATLREALGQLRTAYLEVRSRTASGEGSTEA